MNNQDELASLFGWNVSGAAPHDAYARMAAHPRFAEAVRTFVSNYLAAGEKDKALDGIFKDAGRYIAAMIAIYLHATGGLTLPRLKELCASSRLVSPGRARAILLYLRYLGYVDLFPVGVGSHAARYMPSANFLSAWRNQLRAALGGAAVIEPAAALVLDRLDSSPVFERFSIYQAEGLIAAARVANAAGTLAILHRNGGAQVLWSLIAADETDAFPPNKPVPFSVAGTARRFGVSRAHVRRLIDGAAQQGLLRFETEGSVAFEEHGRSALIYLYAVQLVELLAATAATISAEPNLFAAPAVQQHNREHPPAVSGLSTALTLS